MQTIRVPAGLLHIFVLSSFVLLTSLLSLCLFLFYTDRISSIMFIFSSKYWTVSVELLYYVHILLFLPLVNTPSIYSRVFRNAHWNFELYLYYSSVIYLLVIGFITTESLVLRLLYFSLILFFLFVFTVIQHPISYVCPYVEVSWKKNYSFGN